MSHGLHDVGLLEAGPDSILRRAAHTVHDPRCSLKLKSHEGDRHRASYIDIFTGTWAKVRLGRRSRTRTRRTYVQLQHRHKRYNPSSEWGCWSLQHQSTYKVQGLVLPAPNQRRNAFAFRRSYHLVALSPISKV